MRIRGEKMKRMVVEVKDDEFYYKIKEKALSLRKSVKDYVIGVIEKDLQKEESNAGTESN